MADTLASIERDYTVTIRPTFKVRGVCDGIPFDTCYTNALPGDHCPSAEAVLADVREQRTFAGRMKAIFYPDAV